MDARDAFDAEIGVNGPDPAERGYFLVERRPDVEHEGFVRLVSAHVGGDEFVVLDSPGGVVVVIAPLGVAEGLRRLPSVTHVGGVTIDPDRLEQAFTVRLEPSRTDPSTATVADRTW